MVQNKKRSERMQRVWEQQELLVDVVDTSEQADGIRLEVPCAFSQRVRSSSVGSEQSEFKSQPCYSLCACDQLT